MSLLNVDGCLGRRLPIGKTELSTSGLLPPLRLSLGQSRKGYAGCDLPVFQDLGIYRRLRDPELDSALRWWWSIVLRSPTRTKKNKQKMADLQVGLHENGVLL